MKTKSLRIRRRQNSAPRAAESITRGMRQIEAMIRDGAIPSQRFTVRTVELPDEPSNFAPRDVRALRDSLNVSQPVFGSLLGISTMLVKAWEQGMRKPSRMARRLMDEIRANPSRWTAKLHHQPIAG